MSAINITAYTEDATHIEAIKAFFKALKIEYNISKSPYNSQFVADILEGEEEIKNNKGISVSLEDLEKLCK